MRSLPRKSARFALILILLMLAVGRTSDARAQDAPNELSVDELHAIIAAGAAEIDAAAESEKPQAVRHLQARLAPIDHIILANGDSIRPDFSFIDPEDPAATLTRLRLLDEQLTLAANDDVAARMALLQETLQELGLEKKATVQPHPAQSPRTLFDSTAAQAMGAAIKWGIILAGGALLIFIIGNWLAALLGGVVEDADLRRPDGDGKTPLTARQARRLASQMAQAGDYREAVRHLYLSVLFKLEESGFAPRDRSKTNRELLAAVQENGAVRQHLQPVVETFDRVWYGVREPDAATFQSYAAEIDALMQVISHDKPPHSPEPESD